MSRQPKEAYYLSDAEKRYLIQLIQQGKPLPEQYRFVLLEDKREVELVWNGKSREVCTTVLPFQSLEHVDEPRREAPESPQLDLFDFRGRQLKGWTNKLIWGDNKLILSSLKSGAVCRQIEEAGGLKLICKQGQLIKTNKDKEGVVTRETLTKHWTDWVDYWAVDFDYMSRKEIIKVAKDAGVGIDVGRVSPPGRNPTPEMTAEASGYATLTRPTAAVEEPEFEERWTGGYIFENEWQSFRTRKNRTLGLISAPHTYTQAGRYTVAVKVIDIFGNDTMTLVPVSVG